MLAAESGCAELVTAVLQVFVSFLSLWYILHPYVVMSQWEFCCRKWEEDLFAGVLQSSRHNRTLTASECRQNCWKHKGWRHWHDLFIKRSSKYSFSFYEKATQRFCKGSDLPALNFHATIPISFGMRIWETLDKKSWIELQQGNLSQTSETGFSCLSMYVQSHAGVSPPASSSLFRKQ